MPKAIDLFCGLGGWTDGLIAEGYDVTGYDIEEHAYGDMRYQGKLIVQDVCTLHGAQFKDVDLIVASPPCQEYSYMAMPWSLAKAKAKAIREDTTGEKLAALNRLFNECFRIQKEASIAAGRHIPLVVENVRGAQPWVGRARWNFGSFYLWGDVPALMPATIRAPKVSGQNCNRFKDTGEVSPHWRLEGLKTAGHTNKRDGHAHTRHLTNQDEYAGTKNSGGSWFNIGSPGQKVTGQNPVNGIKQPGIGGVRANGKGDAWFQDGAAAHGSKSSARKAASAKIAMIPLPLSRHIGAAFKPL
jgi:hypothetical protein